MISVYLKKPHSDFDYVKQMEFLQQHDQLQKKLLFLWDDVELEGIRVAGSLLIRL